ncbi:hypothetical protein CAMGR0001_2274 [Campylobacter gracilis RM3268]|uniref:Uncharacterized protein n=1 Tax=Campylobacter gracilis RM3268 TaxID=553220 RepID=C8PH86_9BACT|nr:hypothetical protein CAMGR0001_2274 [Campylobacter gracilis RM3268]
MCDRQAGACSRYCVLKSRLSQGNKNFKISLSAWVKFTAPKAGCGGFKIYARIARLADRGLNLAKFDHQIYPFGG